MLKNFDSLAQKIIYGHKVFFSDFVPVLSEKVSNTDQEEFHSLLKKMIDIIYDNPSVLNIPITNDYDYTMGVKIPDDIAKNKLLITKILYEFFSFMYETGIHGIIENQKMTMSISKYKIAKISVKPLYLEFLRSVGIDAVKTKDDIVFSFHNVGLFGSWKLLSEVSSNKFYFACGIFNNDLTYLLNRIEVLSGLRDGYLKECEEKLLCSGFHKKVRVNLGNTELVFAFNYVRQSSGFRIDYTTRWHEIFFTSVSHQGFKAMLEDFNSFDDEIKAHLIKIERGCKNCRECAKPGKNIWAININYKNENLSVCPKWPDNNIDINSIDFYIRFFIEQDKYASK